MTYNPHTTIRVLLLAFFALCIPQTVASKSVMWLQDGTGGNSKISTLPDNLNSPTIDIAVNELRNNWKGEDVCLVKDSKSDAQPEGAYRIESKGEKGIRIISTSDTGLLYGVYDLLRNPEVSESRSESPLYGLRMLNHWDNLDGTVERGYAGHSLWKWEQLPDSISPRYKEYARANASIGINGTVLNNVNASPRILSDTSLQKVRTLADIFRPYGIKVYLSVNFASPMALDSLPTADPLDEEVQLWWEKKADEIYSLIPDFGGFLVKANSEGQPGPMDFGRTHSDGANMLARALKPHGGIVMWRAFVYSPIDADRAKQAYMEFQPLNGKFDPNVIIQIKNGPIDFQPREPYSPLFGAMPASKQMVEFQVTQEYLGHSNHLVFLAPMWKEFFRDINPDNLQAIAGVANIGDSENWTAHPFAEANWYAFGRLAWNPRLSSVEIADEWLRQALIDPEKTPADITERLKEIMTGSREAAVDYMMPLGLHHIFAFGHHYGPEPWCDVPGARADWLPKYYHQADTTGIGFDRSPSGSDAVEQYPDSLRRLYGDIASCPEEYLLWFHHVPWTRKMKSGRTLWEELCTAYQRGCDTVDGYVSSWETCEPYVKPEIYADVLSRLQTQTKDARWWRDACLLYFARYSRMPIPSSVGPVTHSLPELMKVSLGISNYESPSPQLLDKIR